MLFVLRELLPDALAVTCAAYPPVAQATMVPVLACSVYPYGNMWDTLACYHQMIPINYNLCGYYFFFVFPHKLLLLLSLFQ